MQPEQPSPFIRLATPADLEFIRQDGHISEEIARRKIKYAEVFVVEENGQPVGYARIEYLWSEVPFLALIWLLPTVRGRGLGRVILNGIADYLRERGHTWLYSSSQADEPQPQAWHRRAGFQECGYLAGLNDGGVGEVFFRKHIGLLDGTETAHGTE